LEKTAEHRGWISAAETARDSLPADAAGEALKNFVKTYPRSAKVPLARYTLAEQKFAQGKYQDAATLYEAFERQHPAHPLADSAAYRAAECYFNLHITHSAMGAWRNLLGKYPRSALAPDALEMLSSLYIQTKEWGRADEVLKRLRSQYPASADTPSAREKTGAVWYYLGDYLGSSSVLDNVDGPMAAYYRAFALFSLKLYDDTAASLKDLVPGKVSEEYSLSAAFLKGESFFQKGAYLLALGEFRQFMARYPRSSLNEFAQLRLAACHLLTRSPAESAKTAKPVAASANETLRSHAFFILGTAASDQKDFAAALAAFDQVRPQAITPELASHALFRKMWATKQLGRRGDAVAALKQLESQYPASPALALGHYVQAVQKLEDNQWADAGPLFESALLRHPYSTLSEAELALMSFAFTRAKRPDQLVTAANSALRTLEKNYSDSTPYWRAQSNYYLGRAYHTLKQYPRAVPYLEKIIQNYGDHPLAASSQLLLAQCLALSGQTAKARTMAEGLADNPKSEKALAVSARFLVAVTHFNDRDYDHAISALGRFLEGNPWDALAPQARYMAGLAYYQKNVFGSAIDEWASLEKDFPASPQAQDALLQTGDLYFKAGKFTDAAKSFKTYRERRPQAPHVELAHWRELQSYFNGKEDEVSIKAYPAFLEKYPEGENVDDAKKQLEMVYYRRGADGSPDKLQEFLTRYPHSPFAPHARYTLGEMGMQQEKWGIATREFEQFLRDFPTDNLATDALYNLGQAYEKSGATDKAVFQYDRLLNEFAAKPAAVDGAFRLGSLHFTQNHWKEALAAFAFAARQKLAKDVRANVTYNIALCHENLGQMAQAADQYAAYARLAGTGDKEKEQARDARLTAGFLHKKVENFPKAIAVLEELLKDPGTPALSIRAVNLLADSYRLNKNEPKAVATYEKLAALEPAKDDGRLAGLAQLAYLREQRKEIPEAIKAYELIAASDGKAEWVQAAKQKIEALSASASVVP
jgi:TolA-binding protein